MTAGRSTGTTQLAGDDRSWLMTTARQVANEVRQALREVSLKELAWAALPGLAGILFFVASGIGIGHRQARFGFALQYSGTARFASGGPLGVVRSGGFVAVRARATGSRRSVAPSRRAA